MAPKRPTQNESEDSPDLKRRARAVQLSAVKTENEENLQFVKPKRTSKKERTEESEEDNDNESVTPVKVVREAPRASRSSRKQPKTPSVSVSVEERNMQVSVIPEPKQQLQVVQSTNESKSLAVIETHQHQQQQQHQQIQQQALPSIQQPVSLHIAAETHKEVAVVVKRKNVLSDEREIVSIWQQSIDALHAYFTLVVPSLTIILLACYLRSLLAIDQTIAIVGVVFALMFALILMVYFVLTVPFVLLSRVITSMFNDNEDSLTIEDLKSVNLNSRLFLICTLLLLVCVIFTHSN